MTRSRSPRIRPTVSRVALGMDAHGDSTTLRTLAALDEERERRNAKMRATRAAKRAITLRKFSFQQDV